MDSPIGTGTLIRYLVYVAGIKVPASQVEVFVDSQQGTVEASVQMPANDLIIDLGKNDRVQVAIFYLDSWRYKNNPTFCLLCEGYIAGTSYSSTSRNKSLSLNVKSNMNILQSMYLEFLGGGESSSGKIGKPGTAIPNELTFKGKFPGQLFTVGLDNKTQIRAPYELVQNIFLATTGEYKDKDVIKAADKKELEAELTRIDNLVKLNYESKTKFLSEAEKKLFENEQREQLEKRAESTGSKIDTKSSIVDLQASAIKAEVTSLLKKRSLNARTAVSSGFFARFFNLSRLAKHVVASPVLEGLINSSKDDKKKPSMPSGVFPILRTSRGSQYLKALARQSGYKYGDNGSAKALLSNLFSIFNYSLSEIIAPPAYEVDDRGLPSGKFNKASSNNAIASFQSKPNSLFSVPPACNVIFPSTRVSIQTNSNYEALPTRVYFQKSSQGRKLNLDNKTGDGYAHMDSRVGYPPAIARHAMDSAKAVKGELEILVFPEEYYAGPKTIYKEINPLLYEIDKIEKASRLQDETSKIAASTLSQLDTGFLRSDQANYAREASISAKSKGQNNYDLYLKQAKIDYETARASSSTCQIVTTFNPYVVVGFSAIVVDTEQVGCHLIGTVSQVAHTLSGSSSSTTIVLSAVRPIKGMIEDILLEGGKYDMAPLEPISEVRSVLQKIEAANFYYANLLYRDGEESLTNPKELLEYFDKLSVIRNKQVLAENELEVLEVKASDKDSARVASLRKKLEDLETEASTLVFEFSQTNSSAEVRVKAACDYRKLFGFKDPSSARLADRIIPLKTGDLLRDYTGLNGSGVDTNSRVEILSKFSKLQLVYANDKARTIANSYEAAMDYVSRPVCTLEQYIDFYKQSTMPSLSSAVGGRGRGVRIKASYLDQDSTIGKHYDIIREFVGGPGIEPGAKTPKKAEDLVLSFISEGPNNSAIKGIFTALPENGRVTVTDLPDTIKDWQELLLDYIEQLKRSGVLQ
jgi:hypothetical protein